MIFTATYSEQRGLRLICLGNYHSSSKPYQSAHISANQRFKNLCGSDSPDLEKREAKARRTTMDGQDRVHNRHRQTMRAEIHDLIAGDAESSQQSLLQIKPAMIARNSYVHRELSIRFLAIQNQVVPTSRRSDSLGLSWPPGMRLVFKDRRSSLQDRVNNSPRFLDIIFPGE